MKYLKYFEQSGSGRVFFDLKTLLRNENEFFLPYFLFPDFEPFVSWKKNHTFGFISQVYIEEETNTLIYNINRSYFSIYDKIDFDNFIHFLEKNADELEYRNCYLDGIYMEIEFELIEYLEKLMQNQNFYDYVIRELVILPKEFEEKVSYLGQEYGFFDAEK